MNSNLHSMSLKMRCPACASFGATPFFDGGRQPIATLGWPESSEQAKNMKRLPLSFVSCANCGHVFNEDFRYEEVPYANNPNRMYNASAGWVQHLNEMMDALVSGLGTNPVVVEIGCGAGLFLQGIAKRIGAGRYVGFDPNGDATSINSLIEFRQELFDPLQHCAEIEPDLIICRHVVEHITEPLKLFQPIARMAELANKPLQIFVEVPCIDAVLESLRISDFFYEHISNFTSDSFRCFLQSLGGDIRYLKKGYGGEVVYALTEITALPHSYTRAAFQFHSSVSGSRAAIAQQLQELSNSGRSTAIWGGSGKAAAFINFHSLDAQRFPLVVDSDPEKVGFHVPGAGQKIVFRDTLRHSPVDTIIIPTQWRARDIRREIVREGIGYRQILIEHTGLLIDFDRDTHPYV